MNSLAPSGTWTPIDKHRKIRVRKNPERIPHTLAQGKRSAALGNRFVILRALKGHNQFRLPLLGHSLLNPFRVRKMDTFSQGDAPLALGYRMYKPFGLFIPHRFG